MKRTLVIISVCTVLVSFSQSHRIDYTFLGLSKDSVFMVLEETNVTHHYDTSRYEVYEVFSMEDNLYGYYFFDKLDHKLHHYKVVEPHYVNGRTEYQNIKKNRKHLAKMLNNNQKYNCSFKQNNYVEEITTFLDECL